MPGEGATVDSSDVERRLAGTRFGPVHWFAEIDSTNRWLLDRAREGAAEGVVAVADHQTAGRGRLGRTWTAPPGASLLTSILLRPDLPPARLHLVTAAVALAAADACAALAGVEPELKWPNDLLVGDRKLAGVLAEADLREGAPPAVVVGIGLNVRWPRDLPPELAEVATALNRLRSGPPPERADLLVALLEGLERRCQDLDAVAAEHRGRCATVGRRVRVDLGASAIEGVAVDVTDDGHLVVDAANGRHVVPVGDVVHSRSV